jgi:transcriptional regulator with XRE-family HTH domain
MSGAHKQTMRLILAENVRARMDKLEMSVREVKDGTGMSLDMVYKILKGKTGVGFDNLGLLATYLRTTVAELMTPMNGSQYKGFKSKAPAPPKKSG